MAKVGIINRTGGVENGNSKKTIKGEFGNLEIAVPRDRNSTFDPVMVPKRETLVGQAEADLTSFAKKWEASHPTISESWRNNWERIISLFPYPPEIRKAVYATNAIDLLTCRFGK